MRTDLLSCHQPHGGWQARISTQPPDPYAQGKTAWIQQGPETMYGSNGPKGRAGTKVPQLVTHSPGVTTSTDAHVPCKGRPHKHQTDALQWHVGKRKPLPADESQLSRPKREPTCG